MPIAKLDRTIISITGENVEEFLDGLTTNSMKASLSFAALLTPQGKIIADFFVHKIKGALVLETPSKFGKALLMRLKMYKLRAPITLTDISDEMYVYALWQGKGKMGQADPRSAALGYRLLTPDILNAEHTEQDYDSHRLSCGVPDSTWDFESQSVFPADVNMDQLSGVDYKKGCFIGQEVVSRMHRKTEVRKRMRVLKLSGAANSGDEIMAGSVKIGVLAHVSNDMGIGILRLDRLAKAGKAITIRGNTAVILEA